MEFPLYFSEFGESTRQMISYKKQNIWMKHPWTEGDRPFVCLNCELDRDTQIYVEGELVLDLPKKKGVRCIFAHYVDGVLDHFYVHEYDRMDIDLAKLHAINCPYC